MHIDPETAAAHTRLILRVDNELRSTEWFLAISLLLGLTGEVVATYHFIASDMIPSLLRASAHADEPTRREIMARVAKLAELLQ